MPVEAGLIRTVACPRCRVCGSAGIALHEGLPDLMHETPGRWRLVRCACAACALVWLDPCPVAEDLAQLYAAYFTHEAGSPAESGLKSRVRRAMQRRLLGYAAQVGPPVQALGDLLSLIPWYRASALREVFWLPAAAAGLLLDVGCGNGRSMQRFVQAGWRAVGTDMDPAAVAAARAAGLDARAGALREQRFADGQFDLILMSHVIEHMLEPLEEMRECRRVLKRGGALVIATPNAAGLGHRVFGRHWLGLETPRHLQIFTPGALARLLAQAGFRTVSLRTDAVVAANWMIASQWRRQAERAGRCAALPTPATRVPARWLALARLEALGVALGASWGDELIGRFEAA